MRRLPLFLLVTLAACSTAEERRAHEEQRETAICTRHGLQPGTADFDDCRLQIRSLREQREADRLAASGDTLHTSNRASSLPAGAIIPLP
jgi:hypothetical protein